MNERQLRVMNFKSKFYDATFNSARAAQQLIPSVQKFMLISERCFWLKEFQQVLFFPSLS